ncbi:uncharacterized protein ACIB01_017238 [Guaruba guarouba]
MQEQQHAGLIHQLQYLESDVMLIALPIFNGVCDVLGFVYPLAEIEKCSHQVHLCISNHHSSDEQCVFTCIAWNSAVTLHQTLLLSSRSCNPHLHPCTYSSLHCLCCVCPILSLPCWEQLFALGWVLEEDVCCNTGEIFTVLSYGFWFGCLNIWMTDPAIYETK